MEEGALGLEEVGFWECFEEFGNGGVGVGGGLVEGLVGVEVEEDGEEVGREFRGDCAELQIVSSYNRGDAGLLTASTLVRRSRSSVQALQIKGLRCTLLIKYSLASSMLLLLARITP